jgi:hypothetical protein
MVKLKVLVFLLLGSLLFVPSSGSAAEEKGSSAPANQQKLTLSKAVMCESLKEHAPYNPGVVFPLRIGKIHCFTEFDTVPKRMTIYHNWYYRSKLSARVKLNLQPPRWSTYSTIQLEEADRGPWRVEITDQDGLVIGIVRFSITD